MALDGSLMEDGHYVSGIVQENYGFAGREFVEHIQGMEKSVLVEQYRELFEALCRLDTTDKQAMAMACLLLADRLASSLFFPGEPPVGMSEAGRYLQSVKDVDVAERAYQAVLNWAAKNPVRFEDPKDPSSPNKGEVWGKIERNEKRMTEVLVVNRDVLQGFLEQNRYDYTAVVRKWAEKERLIRNSQGKFIHQTKVYGIKSSYVKLALPEGDDSVDSNGFLIIDEVQETLPFI